MTSKRPKARSLTRRTSQTSTWLTELLRNLLARQALHRELVAVRQVVRVERTTIAAVVAAAVLDRAAVVVVADRDRGTKLGFQ